MDQLLRLFVRNPDTPATTQIVDTICQLIALGVLVPGDRLPSLSKLADHMGIDTFSVNLAYTQLQKQEIVSARRRSGSFVASAQAVYERIGGIRISNAILACRQMGMNEREIKALTNVQIERHFQVKEKRATTERKTRKGPKTDR